MGRMLNVVTDYAMAPGCRPRLLCILTSCCADEVF